MGTQVVILTGNLGKDAEMRFTPTGTPILNFSLPIDIGFGEKKETMWVRCAMFGERAQKLAEHLTKGKGVQVVGEFRMPTIYEGKNGNDEYFVVNYDSENTHYGILDHAHLISLSTVNMDFNVNQLSFVGGAKEASSEDIPW